MDLHRRVHGCTEGDAVGNAHDSGISRFPSMLQTNSTYQRPIYSLHYSAISTSSTGSTLQSSQEPFIIPSSTSRRYRQFSSRLLSNMMPLFQSREEQQLSNVLHNSLYDKKKYKTVLSEEGRLQCKKIIYTKQNLLLFNSIQ